jgi:uncharacterized protein (DUF2126 family)/transglutaminase-like putative cysteine protease
MSIHAALNHVTYYEYDRLVQLGPQIIRLRPAPHCRSKIISYALKIEPDVHFMNWQQDPFANYQARLVFPSKTKHFKVTVDLVAEMAVYNPFDFFLEASATHYPFSYSPSLAQELAPYLVKEPLGPKMHAYLQAIPQEKEATNIFLVNLNQQLQRDIRYLIRMEPGVQSPEETLTLGSGSCRDTSWLLVQLLRHCGLAARFVSGYLIQLTPDVKSLDGPSGTAVDFTDLHAWCEVYLPGAGWIGLDPTSGLLAGEGHIPLAATPSPSSAAPIEGGVDPCEVEFSHHMQVSRIYESPRVTKPYTAQQWDAIMALGEQVDTALKQGDVRLTMGGEPTFVATQDRDAPEWNTDALGPTKRGFATELLHKLRHEYATGGLQHFGQGKWYPGEQLPRWALSVYWRADGEPIWNHPECFADERQPSHYTSDDAARFIQALAAQLDVNPENILPGYEDTWYYLWRERKLPINVDPFDSRLDDAMERARLRRVFAQKLDSVVGYLLPLQAQSHPTDAHRPLWQSGSWFLRDERLYLLPGDSPMGLRLPLDSLPWVRATDYPYHIAQDPFVTHAPLPQRSALQQPRPQSQLSARASAHPDSQHNTYPHTTESAPAPHTSAAGIVRTALCVEVRDPRRANGPKAESVGEQYGVLYVFMPPLQKLEDYLCLVSAIEQTALQLQMKIVIEGYPPPRDPRLKVLQVTPDPGVIEVNIHPVTNWKELVYNTEFLYQAAFESRLCAEKFMTDGRHTGTGGGNHFVLGGATPADSPFLRKPELLASLLLYWHNHPSLSYLFSGLFIGPTSQAPRVDEARNDQLYELEIALEQIFKSREVYGDSMPPWLVDRTLRNILIDVTGNTHRSEFSIDKLYSPDSATGRLGLLELRAFEMPPHPHMSSVQQLLLRALVARFWNTPYRAPVSRWGTALHDRFMLPSFIQLDLHDVIQDMQRAGFSFDEAWFAPHFTFRFPLAGALDILGMQLTLRNALEPWHVMGEEGSAGGTVRYVDSSLERIEVKINGFNPQRYVITCNGHTLPLQPTGVSGEYVAGVRYKAWNPPSALHPTIAVHAPLTFDIVDTWNQRAIGGCQYHVSHPGGRNYDTLPINAFEAESRRLSRFNTLQHSMPPLHTLPRTERKACNQEFPFTLDLRHAE